MADSLDRDGAEALRLQIEHYWIEHGLVGVRTWLEHIEYTRDSLRLKADTYAVRSNIGELLARHPGAVSKCFT